MEIKIEENIVLGGVEISIPKKVNRKVYDMLRIRGYFFNPRVKKWVKKSCTNSEYDNIVDAFKRKEYEQYAYCSSKGIDKHNQLSNLYKELSVLIGNKENAHLLTEHIILNSLPKISVSDVKRELGLKVGTKSDVNPVWVSNNGVTINKAAELIYSDYFDTKPLDFTQDIRDVIISFLPFNKKQILDSLTHDSRIKEINKQISELENKEEINISTSKDNFDMPFEITEDESMLFGIDRLTEAQANKLGCVEGLGKVSESVYDKVNDFIMDFLKSKKTVKWQKGWTTQNVGSPANYNSKSKPYRGVNAMITGFIAQLLGYKTFYYVTAAEIRKRGGKLKKDAEEFPIFFYAMVFKVDGENTDEKTYDAADGEKKSFPVIQHYKLYNTQDVEGVEWRYPKPNLPFSEDRKVEVAESIIKNYPKKPAIQIRVSDRAFYSPDKDVVVMPKLSQFESVANYYSVFFHELIHSTGHKKRLKRVFGGKFGTPEYAFEELVAEYGAMLLSETAQLKYQREQSATYIKNWLTKAVKLVKDDKTALFRAFNLGGKAANHILNGKTYESKPSKETVKVDKKGINDLLDLVPKYEDYDYNLYYAAFRNTSFTPDKRAQFRIEDSVIAISDFKDKIQSVKNVNKDFPIYSSFERWVKKYLSFEYKYISQQSGIASSMITGSANFPVERNRRKMNAQNNTLNAWLEWSKKSQNKILLEVDQDRVDARPISSTDENAVDKLKSKLKELKDLHVAMKEGNAILRSKKLTESEKYLELTELGFTVAQIDAVINDKWNSGFFLTNNNAKIKQVESRIKELETMKNSESKSLKFDGGAIEFNTEDVLIYVHFDEKPEKEIIEIVKQHGFRWAFKKKVWQRKFTKNGQYTAEKLYQVLKKKDKGLSGKEKDTKTSKKSLDGVMSLEDVANANYRTIGLDGQWLELIGNACHPTKILVTGKGGTGKSGSVLKFSEYLTAKGFKILYVAGEQFGTPTFKELIQNVKLDITNPNITIVDNIDESVPSKNPANYDWIVIDSKDSLKMDVNDFRELADKRYKDKSFIVLSQATKEGNFRGSGEWQNEIDTMLTATSKGVLETGEKNRWGGSGVVNMF